MLGDEQHLHGLGRAQDQGLQALRVPQLRRPRHLPLLQQQRRRRRRLRRRLRRRRLRRLLLRRPSAAQALHHGRDGALAHEEIGTLSY